MGKNLTIISYCKRLDSTFEEIALQVCQDLATSPTVFARYQGTDDGELRRVLRSPGIYNNPQDDTQDIDCLDLVGHGVGESGFNLGDTPIIRKNQPMAAVAELLTALLPRNATVRLLGCMTGAGIPGHTTLQNFSKALNGRQVLGTTTALTARHFDARGLKPTYERFVASTDTSPAPSSLPGMALRATGVSPHVLQVLPAGYHLIERARPLAEPESTTVVQGMRVTLYCAGRLAMLEERQDAPPLLFQWSGDTLPASLPRVG
ncbi:hypothetical protein ACN469_11970 [Corallococcus terminator]